MRKYTILGPLSILFLWIIISQFGIINEFFLPKPLAVIKALWHLFFKLHILLDIQQTLFRWLLGLIIGIIIGIPIGIGMGSSKKIYNFLEIIMDFFRSIPTITLFPLFLVFFGIGNMSKIIIAAWATILYVFINTLYGIREVRFSRLNVARVLRATKWQILFKVSLPSALPSIVVGIRIALSMSLVIVVATEMIMGTTFGLGRRIYDSSLTFAIPEMYAAILITGFLGFFSNKLFILIETKFIHWANK